MIKIAGEYLIFVDKNRENRVIKKIDEFEESLAFFFAANNDGCEEEYFHMYDELLSFIARNGNFVKIKGLQVADIVLPPSDISFEELKELWQIRTKHKEEKE
ncbi:MAG: hypothetical protein ACFFCD_03745 [Promethearchaeota archaeon]